MSRVMEKLAPRVLLALQNAYDKGELKKGWNPSRWRSEFGTSRTGKRLVSLLGDMLPAVRITNVAGAQLGTGSRSVVPPRMSHVRSTLRRVDPLIVIACGRQAEAAMVEAWAGNLIVVPHPAYMVLTNELLEAAGALLTDWLICSQSSWGSQFTETVSRRTGVQVTAEQLNGEQLVRVAYRQKKGHYEVQNLKERS